MDGNGFTVQFGALAAVAEQIAAINGQVQNTLQQLIASANASQASWDGDAKAEWAIVRQKWDTAMNEMTALLVPMRQFVENAGDSMRMTETANAGLFGNR